MFSSHSSSPGTVLGVPIFIVLSGVAYVAFSQGGGYVEMIPLEGYNILTDKSIAAIPLFTLAGYLLAEGSAGKRLLNVVKSSVGWIRGGLRHRGSHSRDRIQRHSPVLPASRFSH